MGYKLYVEVMDHWQDVGLSRAERDDLLVLAENANDVTRETFKSVHAPYILRRAGKTKESWRNAIDALKRKAVLKYAVRDGREMAGRPGQHAVYRIPVLCPEAPHDGLWGQCTRAPDAPAEAGNEGERVTTTVTHMGNQSGDANRCSGNQSGDPSNCLGNQSGAECVTTTVTPSPPSPSFDGPPDNQPPPPPLSPSWKVAAEEVEEEFARKEDPELQDRAEVFVDKLPYDKRRPNRTEREELVRLVALWLHQGWTNEQLMAYCIDDLESMKNRIAVWIGYRLAEKQLAAPPALLDPELGTSGPDGLPSKCWRCDWSRTIQTYRGSCGCPFCSLPADAVPAERDALWLKAQAIGIERAGVYREDGVFMQWPPNPATASVPKPRASNEHRGWRQVENPVYGRPTRPSRQREDR